MSSNKRLRRETNEERVKRLTNVSIKAGEGAAGQAAVRAEVTRENKAVKSGGGVRVEKATGTTFLVSKDSDKNVGSFTVLSRNAANEAAYQRRLDIQKKLASGEVLTARDLIPKGGLVLNEKNLYELSERTGQNIDNLNERNRLAEKKADEDARLQRTTQLFYPNKPVAEETWRVYAAPPKQGFFENKIAEYETQKARGQNSLVLSAKLFGAGFAQGVVEDVRLAKRLFKNPFQTTKEVAVAVGSGAKAVYQNPRIISEKILQTNEAGLGRLTYGVAAPIGQAKLLSLGKEASIIVRAPSKVAPELVIDAAVLGGQRFPKPIISPMADFNKARTPTGEFNVVSAGPSTYPSTVITAGKKALKGVEDAGLWVTPEGRASAHFLEIGNEFKSLEFTLNPFKQYTSALQTPSITSISVNKVSKLPKSVLKTKGFEVSNAYEQAPSRRGQVFITKRSTTGISGRKPDTGELEGIYPAGNTFFYTDKLAGYTTYKGKVVALRKARTFPDSDIVTTTKIQNPVKNFFKKIESSYSRPSTRGAKITPYFVFKGQSYSSGRSSRTSIPKIPTSSYSGSKSEPSISGTSYSKGSSGTSYTSSSSRKYSPIGSSYGGSSSKYSGSSYSSSDTSSSYYSSSGRSTTPSFTFPRYKPQSNSKESRRVSSFKLPKISLPQTRAYKSSITAKVFNIGASTKSKRAKSFTGFEIRGL